MPCFPFSYLKIGFNVVLTLLSDEMFTFGYSQEPPYCTYRVITKDGAMLDPVPITIPESVMMHDFAITENYSIFMDLPLLFRPKVCVIYGKNALFAIYFIHLTVINVQLMDALVHICHNGYRRFSCFCNWEMVRTPLLSLTKSFPF
jgi:hypothetical protein